MFFKILSKARVGVLYLYDEVLEEAGGMRISQNPARKFGKKFGDFFYKAAARRKIAAIVLAACMVFTPAVAVYADESAPAESSTVDSTAAVSGAGAAAASDTASSAESTQSSDAGPNDGSSAENINTESGNTTEAGGGEAGGQPSSQSREEASNTEAGVSGTAAADSPAEVLAAEESAAASASTASSSADSLAEHDAATTTLAADLGHQMENGLAGTSSPSTASSSPVMEEEVVLDNASSDPMQEAYIQTGNAAAEANVVNVASSNIVDSQVIFELASVFGNMFGNVTINFGTSTLCGQTCTVSQIAAWYSAMTNVTNELDVAASTGSNAASAPGDVSVLTGNAYAAANVINIVNSNIIDSSYLSFILNVFGSWDGDLELPAADLFGSGGVSTPAQFGHSGTGSLNSDVSNSLSLGADSGGNSASSTLGSASVLTGDASTAANLVTVANTTMLGGNSLLVFVRTFGEWKGTVLGLPDGVRLEETPGGYILAGEEFFDQGPSIGTTTCQGCSTRRISSRGGATSSSSIANILDVHAVSGSNAASSTYGSASIETGNAYAAANAVNFANVNILGKNWILAILNIFGDWNGNIAFGRPNLWIGSTAEQSGNPLESGSTVTYTYTYRNNGSSRASGVTLASDLSEYVNVINPGGGTLGDRRLSWNVGDLEPGKFGSVTFTAQVHPNRVPYGETVVANSTSITGSEEDADSKDNRDVVAFSISKVREPIKGGDNYLWADLQIEKKHLGGDTFSAGSKVDYSIRIWNQGPGSAMNVRVKDILSDEYGNEVFSQDWDLGEVFAHEEIFLDYTVALASSTPRGVYTNRALAEGTQVAGMPLSSGESVSSITVTAIPGISVDLASSTPASLAIASSSPDSPPYWMDALPELMIKLQDLALAASQFQATLAVSSAKLSPTLAATGDEEEDKKERGFALAAGTAHIPPSGRDAILVAANSGVLPRSLSLAELLAAFTKGITLYTLLLMMAVSLVFSYLLRRRMRRI